MAPHDALDRDRSELGADLAVYSRVRLGQGLRDDGAGLRARRFQVRGGDTVFLPRDFQSIREARNCGARIAGLAIAREIVLAHGGNIGVESEKGKGSEFFFTLPALV